MFCRLDISSVANRRRRDEAIVYLVVAELRFRRNNHKMNFSLSTQFTRRCRPLSCTVDFRSYDHIHHPPTPHVAMVTVHAATLVEARWYKRAVRWPPPDDLDAIRCGSSRTFRRALDPVNSTRAYVMCLESSRLNWRTSVGIVITLLPLSPSPQTGRGFVQAHRRTFADEPSVNAAIGR